MTVGESVKLRCVNGDGAAVGICSSCREPVCEQCVDSGQGDEIVCRTCSYKQALTGVNERAEARQDVATRLAKDAKKEPDKVRRGVGWVALLAVAGVLALWTTPAVLDMMSSGRPYALGPMGDDDVPGLDGCLEGLWTVRVAMDEYRYRHKGKSPASLAALEGIPAECPGCDAPWRYATEGKGYLVECPNPRSHGRSAVFLDDRVGPPQVRLDGRGQ